MEFPVIKFPGFCTSLVMLAIMIEKYSVNYVYCCRLIRIVGKYSVNLNNIINRTNQFLLLLLYTYFIITTIHVPNYMFSSYTCTARTELPICYERVNTRRCFSVHLYQKIPIDNSNNYYEPHLISKKHEKVFRCMKLYI